jgi:hypothetical protein
MGKFCHVQDPGEWDRPFPANVFQARRRRKQLLNQQRLGTRGLTNNLTSPMQCGHFSDEYVNALKGRSVAL